MFQLLQNFFQNLYTSCNRLYKSVSWEFGRYSAWDWLTLIGLALFFILIIIFVLGIVTLAILWPLALIWAINLLFHTAVPITFWTWLAVVVLAWAWKVIIVAPFVKLVARSRN